MKVDPKLLEGLEFKTSKSQKVEEDGKKVTRYYPDSRPMEQDDIIGMKDMGDRVVIVSADGRKHRVAKTGKPADKK
jgi:hypothetical protein